MDLSAVSDDGAASSDGEFQDAGDFGDAHNMTIPKPSGSGGASGGGGPSGNGQVVEVVSYDVEDKQDHADVHGKLTSIAQLPYDADNVDKWVRRLERRMKTAGIGTQWSKRLVKQLFPPTFMTTWMSYLIRGKRIVD